MGHPRAPPRERKTYRFQQPGCPKWPQQFCRRRIFRQLLAATAARHCRHDKPLPRKLAKDVITEGRPAPAGRLCWQLCSCCSPISAKNYTGGRGGCQIAGPVTRGNGISTGWDFRQIVIVPAGPFPFGLAAHFAAAFLTQPVQGPIRSS